MTVDNIALRGELIRPEDEGYHDARRVWNAMIDRRPALIARCAGAADVISAVNLAREREMLVSIRGGGHNVAGNAVCDDGLMIDLSPMKGIRVDPAAMTARAEPGVVWAEFDRETQAFGLATTGGLVGSTGIAGYTLGGGYGWLQSKHGLACDNLLSADVVTADGRLLRASAEENSDLFWALRGGGGNFGVVTSYEYRLHPLGEVLAGIVVHPVARAPEVLRFYREFTADAPDELTIEAGFATDPEDGSSLICLVLCYSGDVVEGERVIEPVRKFGPPIADMISRMPYTALQSMFDEALPPGRHNYWKSSWLGEASDEALDTIVQHASAMASPYSMVFLQHFHGAYSRVGAHETAYPHRDPSYNLLIFASWTDPAESEHVGWARELFRAMQPHAAGKVFPNFLGQDEDAQRVRSAYGENYERLLEVKNRYDPTNFFRMNQNIQQGRPGSEKVGA